MKPIASLALLFAFWFSTAFAADAPAAPATARTVIKISVALAPDSKETVTALLDVNDAPQFKEWGVKAANYALKWYPELAKQLDSKGFVPPREFTIRIRKDKGVAATSGDVITINSDYVKDHQEDLGMVAHELVHVIQHYKRAPGYAGWLVEGIADYERYFVVEPGSKNARYGPNSNYKQGYQPAAALLNYIEKKSGPGTVARLNQALREGKYEKTTFKEITGGEAEDLWRAFKESK